MSSCCTPDGNCRTQPPADAATDSHVTTYKVEGVGSAHCQGVVSDAVSGLDSVTDVTVEIGTGLVTVTTGDAPDDGLIAKTVEEAGYAFVGRV